MVYRIGLGLIGLLVLAGCFQTADESTIEGRWYTLSQVEKGKTVYQANCMACHGSKGQSIANWRTPFPNGSYPPPPLNGTGHTWHHSLDQLKGTVYHGSRKSGGSMPAFGHKISPTDIESVIAYVQSWWPESVYQSWVVRSGTH